LPISIQKRRGNLQFEPSIGGLATGLSSFYKDYDSLWVGWPGISRNKIRGKESEVNAHLLNECCHPVFLTEQDIDKYYHGFCNRTIWPLFHYLTLYTAYSKSSWQAYERVNEIFANTIADVARDEDIIWIHDYHLMLLPRLIRERLPRAKIGFFLHIPFPSFEIFRLLPWRQEILQGFLGADLIGFHTYDYARHFLDSVQRLLGYEAILGQINTPDHTIKVDTFPIGIDYERFATASQDRKVQLQINKFRKKVGERKIILSIDRLDYTKGIAQRLEAYNLFLGKNPKYKEKIILILVVVPSRIRVEQYTLIKKQIDELVGTINGQHGTIGWTPIWYLYQSLPFQSLTALYNIADVALVTPLRDGMNLIAKEYIATKTDEKGVLILSETAGAAKELGEAIIINVNSLEEMVNALENAMTLPEEEQIERNRVMRQRLQRYDINRWANEFIDRLLYAKKLQKDMRVRALTPEPRKQLISDFHDSAKRLILLDYDGTLTPFIRSPKKSKPSDELIKLLQELSGDPKNELVLISGRDRHTLGKWFNNLNLNLVAEHGVWIKTRNSFDDGNAKKWFSELYTESATENYAIEDRDTPEQKWEMIQPLTSEWKTEVYPILEIFVDRTPGSFIEEKDFSLAWHYRKADTTLGELRARELVNDLLNITANLNLQVLEGSKVIEIKNASINKGQAALRWLARADWDFILAMGDDLTDEDVFKVLPPIAWSIKIRFSTTTAKYNLASPNQATALLKEMLVSN